jgi:hypothetical protein
VEIFIAFVLALVWFTVRTHRRRASLVSGGAVNSLAWKAANRRRFRLGPRSWRLDQGNTL